MAIRPWQEIAKEQQAMRDAKIPPEWRLKAPPGASVTNVFRVPYTCGIMSKRELELTDKDATELLELLSTGKLKAYELTVAFCKRASIAQQLVSG